MPCFRPWAPALSLGTMNGLHPEDNSNQVEVEQLCEDPGCTCILLMDLTQGSGWLISLPGSTTWPTLAAYRNPRSLSHVLNASCAQLSTVISHSHSCTTQKKQHNQAPGIPHYHNHAIKALPQHSPFSLYILSAFARFHSVAAVPHWSSQVAITGMSEEIW